MVRMSYVGLGDKEAAISAFDRLKPLVSELRELQSKCKPFGRDYMAIAVSLEALDTTAYHFTRRPHFYGARSDSAGLVRPPSE